MAARQKLKTHDIFFLILFPILSAFFVEILRLNYLVATLLFFGLPSLYLSWRNPKLIKRALIFAGSLFVPVTVVLDSPAFFDRSWFVPNSAFRFLRSSVPIEDVVWVFLWLYFAVIFWEFFLDYLRPNLKISPHVKYLVLIVVGFSTAYFLFYLFKPEYLAIKYFYLKAGIVFGAIPVLAVLFRFPKLMRKVALLGIYFLMVSFLAEFVGLRQGHWYFPGEHFLGTTTLAGQRIPYEEMIFWWTLGVPGLVCWYEFFIDDQR
jgi:hypothetical protein